MGKNSTIVSLKKIIEGLHQVSKKIEYFYDIANILFYGRHDDISKNYKTVFYHHFASAAIVTLPMPLFTKVIISWLRSRTDYRSSECLNSRLSSKEITLIWYGT